MFKKNFFGSCDELFDGGATEAEVLEKIKAEVGEALFQQVKYTQAANLFDEIIGADRLAEFLTLGAYDHLQG